MTKKLAVAFIGCGSFARNFVPLFKIHSNAEKVCVCDLIASKANEYSEQYGVEIIPTFEDVLARRVNLPCRVASFSTYRITATIRSDGEIGT